MNLEPRAREGDRAALAQRLVAAERELDALFLEEVAAVLLRLEDERAAPRDDDAAA